MNSGTHQRAVRSHTCGEIGARHLGEEVALCGWVATRRDHGGVIFIDLRDRYGLTQVVFDPEISGGRDAHAAASQLRSEFVLWVKGKVRRRPQGMTNAKLVTGEIEIACTQLKILSEAKTPPFPIDDEEEVSELLRLKYRYLDLRRPGLQHNLITRHRMLASARGFLNDHGFIDVETPILYKSTPEGARDFIVPSRMNPGTFYALPQSPQTLKQLLMVSGMDRYYQVARCFRDEDLRADRQPEFTQIDIEVSFLDEEAFFPLIERMVAQIWKDVLGADLRTPFPQMPYSEAMSRYGSDKPDIRFGLEIQDLSAVFASSQFKIFQAALAPGARGRRGSIRALHLAGQAEKFSRKDLDDLQAHAVKHGAKGLLWIKAQPSASSASQLDLQSPAAKFFTEEEKSALQSKLSLQAGDLVLIVADPKDKSVCTSLGAVRLEIGKKLALVPADAGPAFLWVTRFPLLEYDDQEKRFFACHHPFTSPRPEFMDDFVHGRNLEAIEASAYDLVLNGSEVAGGSLRIYRSDVQNAMFSALNISAEEAKEKFGFFLEALQYGTPPHGGIAFGVDRLAGILCGSDAIRDVIAFPKTQKGHCLMSESPSRVSPEQLVELGIGLTGPR